MWLIAVSEDINLFSKMIQIFTSTDEDRRYSKREKSIGEMA